MTQTTAETPSPAPAIVLPTTNFSQIQRLSILVHAQSKKGKSTFSATAPKPVLVLDAEGSWRFMPVRSVSWNPILGPPPEWDGTWEACIVHVTEWQMVEMAYKYLTQWPHKFVSVVVDSITEMQRRLRENLKGVEAMQIQDWGVLLARMGSLIRGFRDLTLFEQLPVRCVVFVSETTQRDGRWVPGMQGQIANSLPYWVDICAYMYPFFLSDENGQTTNEIRMFRIGPHPQFECGERVQGRLPHDIPFYRPADGQVGNDIEMWMRAIFGIAA